MAPLVAVSVVMILAGLGMLGFGMGTSAQIREEASRGRILPLYRARDRGGRIALVGWILMLAGLFLGVLVLYVL